MELIFDTHAHCDDDAFDVDREVLLTAMPAQGVGLILDPGCDIETSQKAVALAEQYPHVYAAVGYHPENCAPYTPADLDTLRQMAKHPKVVAILNLPPRKMMGLESCGMLISAVHKEKGEEKLHLLMVDDAIPAGAKLC